MMKGDIVCKRCWIRLAPALQLEYVQARESVHQTEENSRARWLADLKVQQLIDRIREILG